MDLLQGIILGLIQGTTEWLPISSTGHLRITEHFFGLTTPLLFDVILHVATLLVTLIYFRKDIKNVLTAIWQKNLQSENGKLIIPIIIGTIPTALMGVLIGNELDTYFNSLPLLGAGFIAGGTILFTSKFGKERNNSITYPQALLIGLIQGTTEWLPISSTGHLRIAEHFFGLTTPLLFDVILHAATLLVTLIYFRKDIKNVLTALWQKNLHSENGKLIIPIIIGTIPTALIGVLIGNELDTYFNSLPLLGAGFIAGGTILFTSKFGKERNNSITYPQALLIGIMQGISIIPSISRSGLTIAVMLLLGIKRELAFKFSFLLSIPAVIGALGVTLYESHRDFSFLSISFLDIIVSFAVAIAVSFLALTILWKTLANNKFYLFAVYCWIIGVILVILSLFGF